MVKGLLVKIEEPLRGSYCEVIEKTLELVNKELMEKGLVDLDIIKKEDEHIGDVYGLKRYHCQMCHKTIYQNRDNIIIIREGKEALFGYFYLHYKCPVISQ